jgi:hypothetical protein
MTSFASANMYQTLDIATTDDKLADLLTAPEIPMDPTATVFPMEAVDLAAPEFPVDDVYGNKAHTHVNPRDTDVALGNALTNVLQRLDDKCSTILKNYNNAQEKQHSQDDAQRPCDKEQRDEQRRQDRGEQHRINTELRMAKKLDFEAILASLKDAFTAEMKDTFN